MNQTEKVPTPTRELTTAQQLNSLLNVLTVLNNTVRFNQEEEGGKNDGGTRMAVENTISRVCDRLDSIIGDTPRWDLSDQLKLEEELSRVYQTHQKLMEEQRDALRLMERPSRRYSPALLKLQDDTWAAILGNLEMLDKCIIGAGVTPEDALADFDKVFKTRQETQPQPTVEAKTNEQSPVEPSRQGKNVSDAKRPLHARRNRKSAGKKSRSGKKNVE